MKKRVALLLVVVLFAAIGCSLAVVGYSTWGRRLVYPLGNVQTKYPGFGVISEQAQETILVSPRGDGQPFFDLAWLRMKYPLTEYDISDLPAQEKLLYVVGFVDGWEDVANSSDKYLLIHTSRNGDVSRYRVSFGGENETLLAVERVGWQFVKKENPVIKYTPPRVSEFGYERLKKDIARGDVVVLTPVFALPKYAKQDENGNYFVLWLVVRRVDGRL
jgi:hypothetical protein